MKHDEPDPILPIPCLYCHRRFQDLASAEQHMKSSHSRSYVLTEDEQQAKALRRYDQERRAQIKAERKAAPASWWSASRNGRQ